MGRILSLMSSDASTIVNTIPNMHEWVWGCTAQTIIPIFYLYKLLGDSFLIAAAATIVVFAVSYMFTMPYMLHWTKAHMEKRDERLTVVNESIRAMLTVKCLAFESTVEEWIMRLRREEEAHRISELHWIILFIVNINIVPLILSTMSFGAYVCSGGTLSLSLVFAAQAWMQMFQRSLLQIPQIFRQVNKAQISFERINEVLIHQEVPSPPLKDRLTSSVKVDPDGVADAAAWFDNVTVNWYDMPKKEDVTAENEKEKGKGKGKGKARSANLTSAAGGSVGGDRDRGGVSLSGKRKDRAKRKCPLWLDDFCGCGAALGCNRKPDVKDGSLVKKMALSEVTLNIQRGKLTVIVGQVSTGKTSLISLLTSTEGDVEGSYGVQPGIVPYASQVSWLQSGSLKNNILMGRPFNQTEYHKTLDATGLAFDLEEGTLKECGDETRVGEGGVKLSGGQKDRVAMARAVYSIADADMFVFDDTLNALDNKTKHKVFRGVFKERLSSKTRVLVTNDPKWLYQAHTIIAVGGKKIEWHGTLNELDEGVKFSPLLKEMVEQEEGSEAHQLGLRRRPNRIEHSVFDATAGTLLRASSSASSSASVPSPEFARNRKPAAATGKADIKDTDEDIEHFGGVTLHVYKNFFRNYPGGLYHLLLLLVAVLATHVAELTAYNWLSIWAAHPPSNQTNVSLHWTSVQPYPEEEFGPPAFYRPAAVGVVDVGGADLADGGSVGAGTGAGVDARSQQYYLYVYLGIYIARVFFNMCSVCMITYGSYFANKKIFRNFLSAVMYTPMGYFFKTNSGSYCTHHALLSSHNYELRVSTGPYCCCCIAVQHQRSRRRPSVFSWDPF